MPTSVPPSSGVNRKRRAAANRTNTQQNAQRRRQKGKQPPNKQPNRSALPLFRLLVVWGVLVGASLGMAVRLYGLQVVQSPSLLEQAINQQTIYLQPFIPRRPVVDRNNSVLAMDRPVYAVYAHPAQFKLSIQKIATELAPLLNRSVSELEKKLNSPASRIRIATGIPEEIIDQISLLRLDGLELDQQYSRLYPQRDLVADVVGYVDTERHGQAGVEYSQDKILKRPLKKTKLRRTGKGGIISYYVPEKFVHVEDLRLQLTLDLRLQRAAQSSLKQQLQKFNAKRGSVIVMDARDGAILAMTEEPSYNPNEYYKYDMGLFKNWALSDLYEPGSTFKPLNVAIALETGILKPNDIFHDSGTIKVGNRVIKNAESKDLTELSVAQILQHSSNVGMVQIMQRIQPADYYNWLKKLGLGKPLQVDLPFEASSQIKSQKQFVSSPIEPATASFGQGFSLTPLQLVQLHAALANGGKLVTPHVVRGLFDANGKPDWQPTLPAPQQVFLPQTTKTVLEMMETVVTQGSGKVAKISGYRIAGKTGTAQKASNKGGYYKDAYITSFVGILPVESPRYVVLAVVDEPHKKGERIFGSTVAAPVVRSVMNALISLEQMPPTH
jgi:cell division protein FtsI (penicillin-binding protein 3)